jgi:hypothetical protein
MTGGAGVIYFLTGIGITFGVDSAGEYRQKANQYR